MLHKISLFLKNNTSLYKQKFIKMSKENFISALQTGYTSKGDFITLGAGMLEGETIAETPINIPLKTLNRHGLIAGATGTGKTKTIQVL